MHPRAPKLLEDIRNAADFVKTATDGVVLHQFKQDRLLRQAVERSFEIIGEASHNIEDHYPRVRRRAPRIARGVRPPDAQCRGSRLLQGGLGDRPEDHSQRPVGPIRAAQEGARKPPAERRRQEEGLIGMPALENIAVACG